MKENLKDKRVIFMGTPQIAADVLQALLDADANLVLAVTQPDRITGRRRVLTPTPVKTLAAAHDIPSFSRRKSAQTISRCWMPDRISLSPVPTDSWFRMKF